MSRPAYDLLLVAHVVAAVVGFGAIFAAGLAASTARRSADPAANESVRRFFTPGRDWPARAILLVPLLGLALLFGGDRHGAGAAWPWIGLGLWLVAAGLVSALCWPAERTAQRTLAELTRPSEHQGAQPDDLLGIFRQACRRVEIVAAVTTACCLAAAVLMIVQP